MIEKMENIEVPKINPFEIAKASDMDKGFKNIVSYLSVFADYFFSFLPPLIEERGITLTETDKEGVHRAVSKKRQFKDFVVGGALVQGSTRSSLRLLPMVALSNKAGIFVTNGKVLGKYLEIDLQDKSSEATVKILDAFKGREDLIENERLFRIVSIYLGDGKTEENQALSEYVDGVQKDWSWDTYGHQWRASSKNDGGFKEYAKLQTQSIRLYSIEGDLVDRYEDAMAMKTPVNDIWARRVKIAEVLVSYTQENASSVATLDAIEKDDIRFVTASLYWQEVEDDDKAKEGEHSYEKADEAFVKRVKGHDNKFLGSIKDLSDEQRKEREKVLESLAFRAEHYNYRWTVEKTRTYSLGSIAEFNERIFKVHKKDGSLKEEVVSRENVFLSYDDTDFKHSLRGEHIYIRHRSAEGVKNGVEEHINLQYEDPSKNEIAIDEKDHISEGFIKVGKAMRCVYGKVDSALEEHKKDTKAHGATPEASANRIAMRDVYGAMKANMPPYAYDDSVINVHYLDKTLKAMRTSLIEDLLCTKLISSQEEFNVWKAQRSTKSYKYVYLHGDFSYVGSIDLTVIQTPEIIKSLPGTRSIITIVALDREFGLRVGYYQIPPTTPLLKDLTIKVEVSAFNGNKTISGVYGAHLDNCNIIVDAQNTRTTYYEESYNVIGAEHCYIVDTDIKAFASNGKSYSDVTKIISNDEYGENVRYARGGTGKNGGHAMIARNCLFSGNCHVGCYGGDGGQGGTGAKGEEGSTWWRGGRTGGDGGRGGDAFCWDLNTRVEEGTRFTGFYVRGGDGGRGGTGGDGYWLNVKNPSWAGRGGQGGNGGDSNRPSFSINGENIHYSPGSGGSGGSSGSGSSGEGDGITWGVSGDSGNSGGVYESYSTSLFD